MKSLAAILLALTAATCALAEVTKLPAEQKKLLRDAKRFPYELKSVAALPKALLTLCGDEGKMADPGQDWQVTDVIVEPRLPSKRLIWAVTDGECYVLHYESGGYSHNQYVVVAKLKTGAAKPGFVWHGIVRQHKPLPNFAAFLNGLDDKTMDDSRDWGF